MGFLMFSSGLVLLTVVSFDLISTALSAAGTGFITRRISQRVWRILLRLARGYGSRRLLEASGPVTIVLICILSTWLIVLWMSASLMFISEPGSLRHVETNTPASVVSKIFYTGYTLSILGLEDIEPYGAFWELLTAIMSFAGLVLISTTITYLIPVVSAEMEKRRISVYITTLGCSVEEILVNAWDGSDFRALESPFGSLTEMIILPKTTKRTQPFISFTLRTRKKHSFST